MTGLNLSDAQGRALAAYSVPGRRLFVQQEDADMINGGPITVAIARGGRAAGWRRLAEAVIDEAGNPEWKAVA